MRKSNVVTCYLSPDGIKWSECGKVKFASLKWKVYVGLAVSGAADGALGAASFDNVSIHGSTAAASPAPSDFTAPSVPAEVVAIAAGPDRIELRWTASTDGGTGVAGYKVFRDGQPVRVATTTTNSFADTGLIPNTHYSYTVSAFDAASPPNESLQSLSTGATTQATPLP